MHGVNLDENGNFNQENVAIHRYNNLCGANLNENVNFIKEETSNGYKRLRGGDLNENEIFGEEKSFILSFGIEGLTQFAASGSKYC